MANFIFSGKRWAVAFPTKCRNKTENIMYSMKKRKKQKKQNKAGISLWPLLLNILLEARASAMRRKKKLKASRLESEKYNYLYSQMTVSYM